MNIHISVLLTHGLATGTTWFVASTGEREGAGVALPGVEVLAHTDVVEGVVLGFSTGSTDIQYMNHHVFTSVHQRLTRHLIVAHQATFILGHTSGSHVPDQ